MNTFIVVVSFSFLSNVNTLYMLQPPDNTTAFPLGLPQKTNTSSRVYDSHLENTQNNSKSVGFPQVVKDTNEKVSGWLSILAFAKKALLDKNSKNDLIHKDVKNTEKTVFTHAQSSKKVENEEITPKIIGSPSNKSPSNINSTDIEEVEKKIEVIETTNKNVDSSLPTKSPSKEMPTKVKEEERNEVVETATTNIESSLSFNKPPKNKSIKAEIESKMEVVTIENVEHVFPYESPSKETPRKVEVISDSVKVESSLSPRPSKNNSTIINNGDSINKKVLGSELLHNSSSNGSEKDSQLIASINNCGSSSSLCESSRVCPYVLVFVGSWFYYHTVKAFW